MSKKGKRTPPVVAWQEQHLQLGRTDQRAGSSRSLSQVFAIAVPPQDRRPRLQQELPTMSYGFQVTAKSKDEAKEKIAAEVAKIAEHQDAHKHDQAAINNAAGAFIDLLGDIPDGCGLYVSLNGSLGWSGGQDDSARNYTGSGFSISASYRHL